MKRIPAMLLLSALALSCSGEREGEYQLNGTLEGAVADNTRVFLKKSDENLQPIEADTAVVSGGTFRFSGTIEAPHLYFIFVEGANMGVPLILEEGKLELTAHKDSLNAALVEGTPQNQAYAEFIEGSRLLVQRRNSIQQEMQEAMMARDTANMNALRDEFMELRQEGMDYEQDFARTHPEALVSALLIDRFLKTKSMTIAELQEMFSGLSEEIRQTTLGRSLGQALEAAGKTAVGSRAPDFSAPTPSGETLALSDVLGKVTLIDFWAAWCRPCRAENPNIVRVYEQYKDKGLSILGVSLDRNADDWKQAILDDGLTWHHVSNVRYFDEIAELYSVNAIPASFILDEKGVIVAKNLRGPELEAKIAELLR
ncbi:TlpA disulfide reductase family protein [Robiginitalea marina]|uniref:AhpC/TSA family protein n=1 Tax=Robiginitalea marina TaxID=2954105 RepID=A0ABT1AUD5_9FLAO|nr:TlpA disulfide reductase family protein [Robiginitalea marina]MCO5723476.1 AhpC/TSA family protein [Robiginitalea marina]